MFFKYCGLCFLLIWFSCAKKDIETPYYVLLEKTSLTYKHDDKDNQKLIIESNTEWSLDFDAAWLQVNKQKGGGRDTLVLQCVENKTGEKRSVVINVRSATLSQVKTITITQEATPKFIVAYQIESSPIAYNDATYKYIDISSNISWSIETDSAWVNLGVRSGSNTKSVPYGLDYNFSKNSRTAMIRIRSLDPDTAYLKEFPVTQGAFVCGDVPELCIPKIRSYVNDFSKPSDSKNDSFTITGKAIWKDANGNDESQLNPKLAEVIRAYTYKEASSGQNITANIIGVFGNDFVDGANNNYTNVSLRLNNLETHSFVEISYDLYLFDSWDGDFFNQIGSIREGMALYDLFKMKVDGTEVFYASFSNHEETGGKTLHQTYPDMYVSNASTQIEHPYRTGAVTETVGVGLFLAPLNTSYNNPPIYRIKKTLSHTANSIKVEIIGEPNEEIKNESWAIGNFELRVY